MKLRVPAVGPSSSGRVLRGLARSARGLPSQVQTTLRVVASHRSAGTVVSFLRGQVILGAAKDCSIVLQNRCADLHAER